MGLSFEYVITGSHFLDPAMLATLNEKAEIRSLPAMLATDFRPSEQHLWAVSKSNIDLSKIRKTRLKHPLVQVSNCKTFVCP